MKYTAFISYSWADKTLAVALERALRKMTNPLVWRLLRRPYVSIFRDDSNLEAGPNLWSRIKHALESSKYLVLIASPASARSRGVMEELRWWLDHKSADTVLIVLAAGEIRWDDQQHDFDFSPSRATAISTLLQRKYDEVPKWVDCREFSEEPEKLSLANPDFESRVADIAAKLRDVPKSHLLGERRSEDRIVKFSVASFVAILVIAIAVISSLYAQSTALYQAALGRNLGAAASASLAHAPNQLDQAALSGVEALRRDTSQPTNDAVRTIAGLLPRPILRFSANPDERSDRPLALSRAGDMLAVTTGETRAEQIHVLSLQNGAEAAHLLTVFLDDDLKDVAFDPSGTMLAVARQHAVQLWSIKSRQLVAERHIPDQVTRFRFSPDGNTLAVGTSRASNAFAVHLYSKGLRQLRTMKADYPVGELQFSATGRYLAWAPGPFVPHQPKGSNFQGIAVPIWDIESGRKVGEPRNPATVSSLAFDPRDLYLVIGGNTTLLPSARFDNAARIWLITENRFLAELRHGSHRRFGEIPGVSAVAIAPTGAFLATAGGDSTVRIWDTNTWQEQSRSSHVGSVLDLAVTNNLVATAGRDGTVRLWDAPSGDEISRFGFGNPVTRVVMSADGQRFGGLSTSGELKLGEPRILSLDACAFVGKPRQLIATATGFMVETATEGRNGLRSILEVGFDGKVSCKAPLIHGDFYHFIIAAGGDRVVATDYRGSLYVSDSNFQRFTSTGIGTDDFLAVDSSGTLVLVRDGIGEPSKRKITLRNARDGKVVRSFALGDAVRAGLIGSGHVYIAIGNRVLISPFSTGPPITLPHSNPVERLWLSNSNSLLATKAGERIWIWDWRNAALLSELDHAGNVQAVAFSADDEYVATGRSHEASTRGTHSVYVWRRSGEKVATLARGPGAFSLAFSPDLRLWGIRGDERLFLESWQPDELIREICETVGRKELSTEEWAALFPMESRVATCGSFSSPRAPILGALRISGR